MPFIGTKWRSATSAVTSDLPDVASIIDEWSSSQLVKTAEHFSRSTAIPIRGSSRSQQYRKEVAADCPEGQNYYSCPSTGFKGCCSKNACDTNAACPENKESEIASSRHASSSESTSKSFAGFATIASSKVSSVDDTTAGNIVSRSETGNTPITPTTGKAVEAAMNATMVLKPRDDIALAPVCPGGNGTRFSDNVNIAYTVRCNYDSTAETYNSIPMGTGGYASCFGNCSASSDCGGFTFVGLDDGTCYFKTRMLRRQYVLKDGNNYISCNKIDRMASSTNSSTSDTATETGTSTPTAEAAASSSKPKVGAIAGGVVGGIAIIALTLFLIAVIARRRRRKNLENKRATVTQIFGGAVEPRRREQDDTTSAIPLHTRNGSTSHDYGPFAAFGGLSTQPQYSSVQAPGYQPQHARQRSTYRPLGELNSL
jgi:hypothetical protein